MAQMLQFLSFLLTLFTVYSTDEDCLFKSRTPATVLEDSTLLDENYKNELPPKITECPAIVSIEFWPIAMREVSVEHMSFAVDAYILLQWQENRLKVPDTIKPNSTVLLSEELAEQLWTPVLALRNCIDCSELMFDKKTNKMFVSKEKKEDNFVTLSYLDRISYKYRCDCDLSAYPMDVQECSLEIQALDFHSILNLVDKTKVHRLMSDSKPPEFKLTSMFSGECRKQDHFSSMYDCIELVFILKRQMAHHIMLTYMPSLLIVSLSWLSFWLDPEAAAPRVSLCLTTLLTLATQFSSAQKNLPPVAYMKAIDVWMFTCMLMVVGSLIEFAVANTVHRRTKYSKFTPTPKTEFHGPHRKSGQGYSTNLNAVFTIRRQNLMKEMTLSENSIDKVCRITFPLTFLIFNIIYWTYYSKA